MNFLTLLPYIVSANVGFSTFECGDNCTPDKCSAVANLACDFPTENFDYADQIGQTGCKTCTQNQSP